MNVKTMADKNNKMIVAKLQLYGRRRRRRQKKKKKNRKKKQKKKRS